MIKQIIVSKDKAGERLDKFLTISFPKYSRNYFLNLIKIGSVSVNKKEVKPKYAVKENDIVEVIFEEKTIAELAPENIPVDIIYQDNNVLIINKQAGIVVHPGAGHNQGTLVNALINKFPEIKEAVFEKDNSISLLRPGLVHRLDKDTSGLIVIARNKKAMHSLSRQIQNRSVEKIYWAICYGAPKKDRGEIVSFLGRHFKNRKKMADIGEEKGKKAVSYYKVLRYFNSDNKSFSLIEFNIKTGRTHQIRVQASNLGNPILGDETYGSKQSIKLSRDLRISRQLLHAKRLSLTLPGDNKKRTFTSSLPQDFNSILEKYSR